MNWQQKPIIAIDGPAGAGKSTIAKIVAARLGLRYIDTGAMYRALTWKALAASVDLRSDEALTQLALNSNIQFEHVPAHESLRIILNGSDVTDFIRKSDVTSNTRLVASHAGVRQIMQQKQRELGRLGGVVMEGRDIGTEVFPQAEFKFYLDASPEERFRRRHQELLKKGRNLTLSQVSDSMQKRDFHDQSRSVSPLRVSADAHIIDSTLLNAEQVSDKIEQIIAQATRV